MPILWIRQDRHFYIIQNSLKIIIMQECFIKEEESFRRKFLLRTKGFEIVTYRGKIKEDCENGKIIFKILNYNIYGGIIYGRK